MNEPKSVQEFIDSENEKAMRAEYFKRTGDLLANKAEYGKTDCLMGLELEVQVVNSETLNIAPEEVRNHLVEEENSLFDKELGAAQLEIRTSPFNLAGGFSILEKSLEERISKGKKLLEQKFGQDYSFLMLGMHPTADVKNVRRSNEDRYKRVPNFHNDFKGSHINTFINGNGVIIDVGDAAIIGLANSIQCNVDAKSFSDAIEKINISFMIGNYVTAITANSRFIDGKDSALAETRMISWEKSHDVRTPEQIKSGEVLRVGLPKDYDKSIEEYFLRVAKHPFILNDEDKQEKALGIGLGLNWNDTRIKVKADTKSVLVEFRPVSTQPTIKENIAAMAFYIGLLTYYQEMHQKRATHLIPFEFVSMNRTEVMEKGLGARVYHLDKHNKIRYSPILEILPAEISKAEQGLKKLGVPNKEVHDYMSTLEYRLEIGTPSDQLARSIYKHTNTLGGRISEEIVRAVKENKLVM